MTSITVRFAAIAMVCLVVGCNGLMAANDRANPQSQAEGDAKANRMAKTSTPGNVIFFLGDGMGLDTVTAARIHKGQQEGLSGEEYELAFESLPHIALSKVYNTNQQVPDSAGTATALLSGVKTLAGVIGVGPLIVRGDCNSQPGTEVSSLLEIAEQRGLATGIISTARITHATPASAYAHSPDRNWENDATIPEGHKACRDIATQLVEFDLGDGPEVVLGGGLAEFIPVEKGGWRTDQRNLIDEWHARRANNGVFVSTGTELRALNTPATSKILGLFSQSHMSFDVDRRSKNLDEPSLTEMTVAAIKHLQKTGSNYFLFIEAGRIDHAHHMGNAARALLETAELSNAVAATLERVSLDDTLIVVTADHGHTFAMGGYPTRGNPILGFVKENDPSGKPAETHALDINGEPYTTVAYLNGLGYKAHRDGTVDKSNPESVDYLQVAGTGLEYGETHSGTDVVFYAGGKGAGKVHGVMEQNAIFPVMLEALGLKKAR